MIANLNPYPAYKESAIQWAPNLPAAWQVRRAKTLFRRMDRPARPSDDVVTCFRDGTVTLRKNRRTTGFTEALHEFGYQGIRKGDLVIHAMDAFAGAAGVSDSDGKGTPVYAVCQPRNDVDPHYFAFIVREMARSKWILALSRGIRERSTDFRFESFAAQYLPVPPLEDQRAVVKFLDNINVRISRAVRAKRELIALLAEQERRMIHDVITRGIGHNSTLAETGGKWFPQLPSGWQAVPLGRVITSAIDGPHFSPNYVEVGIPFLSARNVKVDRWSLEDVKYISERDFEEFNRRVRPRTGDVLYTKGGTTGIARVVDLNFPLQVWVHIAVLKVRKKLIDPEFLAMCLNSPRCYEQSQLLTRGATNQDLGLGRMKRIELPLPPTVSEQCKLVADVNEVVASLRSASERASREIRLLREYRERLIADVVTGKLDARAAAAVLPEIETTALNEDRALGSEELELVDHLEEVANE